TASALPAWPWRSLRCLRRALRSARSRRGMLNCSRRHALPLIMPACTARLISPAKTSKACYGGHCLESQLMDSLNPDTAPIRAPTSRGSRLGEFWSTALWGLFIFAAMFVGQIAVVLIFLLGQGGSIDFAA